MSRRLGDHAIVIGASIGGLLAARALADHFDTVTVLERDHFPAADVPRKGVPQGSHAHGLLARGRDVIEQFFPGWTDEVVQSGGLRGDIAKDVSWIGHGVSLQESDSDLIGLFATRPVLEGHLRRRLQGLPNVQIVEGCTVQELMSDASRSRVNGVRARIDGEPPQIIAASLVVDASGRGSLSSIWLATLDYPRPEEEKIDIGIGYTTRAYRRRPGDLGGRLGVVIAGNAPNWRNGAILAQSDDRWLVSIGGFFGDYAPSEDELYAAYAKSMSVPDIHDVVVKAEPLSEYAVYRFPSNLRRRYERLKRFPEGYLVFGDAVCSFNPVYGQGMTVAAQEALVLRECLARGLDRLAPRFFAAAAAIIDVPWEIAVGNDLRHPAVVGPRPGKVRFINWYVGKLHRAAQSDGTLTTLFLKVANLMLPPPHLLHPAVVWRVIRGNLARPSLAPVEVAEPQV